MAKNSHIIETYEMMELNIVKKYTRAFIMSAVIISFGIPVAGAVKYTTRDKPTSKKEKSLVNGDKETQKTAEEKKVCSSSDKNAIKRFHAITKRKKRDFEELMETKDQVKTPDHAKEFSKAHKKITEFYKTEKFAEMKETYARCDMEIPVTKVDQLFWIYGSENKKNSVF